MRPIGIFDSGIGGLTVARAIANRLPNVPLIYFGDTAHLPYGDKSPELIRHYASRISLHLKEMGCQAIVVACNSASSNALEAIHETAGEDVAVIDVVQPVVQDVSRRFGGRRVGVIGTRATIESEGYQRQLSKSGCDVIALATPLLASAIEEGFHEGLVSEALLQAYLGQGTFDAVNALILGCTHYPLVADQIAALLPASVEIINSAELVADAVAQVVDLESNRTDTLDPTATTPLRQFLVSDLTVSFAQSAQRFFGEEVQLEESGLWEF
ncbi:MAG: glutamate racemase [Flavobacteriales bacterium]|jgi:glutamate racemase|nr:glutamate racemase [Flavobacteriales bacterium]